MWKETRQRQMAQFQNIAMAPEHHFTGHGVNSVTPEQVCVMFLSKKKNILGYSLYLRGVVMSHCSIIYDSYLINISNSAFRL